LDDKAIKDVLKSSGLTENEADVYIFLAKHNVHKGTEIARLLKKDKAQVFRILRRLQTKGYVEATLDVPTCFTVVPFEKIIDSLVKEKQNEVESIKRAKNDILMYLSKKRELDNLEKFVAIKGNNRIYSKISEIVQNTKGQLSIATTVQGLIESERFGVFDELSNHPLRHKIEHRILTELSKQNLTTFKAIVERISKTGFDFKARTPNLEIDLFPRMITRDNEEILFFTAKTADAKKRQDICLWTNCKSLVQALGSVFEDLWNNSIDSEKKLAELETGKPTPKTCIMKQEETAQNYFEMLSLAQEEVTIMTSSKGLIEYSKQKELIEKWKKTKINVKIMAPIIHENLISAKHLQKSFAIRHIPENYMVTTLIDGKHCFQFKTPPTGPENLSSVSNFGNTFYTNEIEYLEKIRNTLDHIWKHAQTLSYVTLEAITGSYGPLLIPILKNPKLKERIGPIITDVKALGSITEKEILDKILRADKVDSKNPVMGSSTMYASIATVVIHPPDFFKLPKMLIVVDKTEKQSTFGAENGLTIFLWLPIRNSTEFGYVPVALVGDNPKSLQRRKAMLVATPAEHNVQLFKKDELQIRVHGNTMFSAWAVPIKLYPEQYVLPPACLMIEGYGNVKTNGFTLSHPSGFKSKIEENYFDAFVTFIHPSSKYSGPGTDGAIARDYIMTNIPPKNRIKP
jgi:sugar-specific transcriptional regulator TrmB